MNSHLSYYDLERIIDSAAEASGFGRLIESPVILNSTKLPYFVNSPLQLYIDKFKSVQKEDKDYVLQTCLRNIPFDTLVSNPLQSSLQPLYAFFSFHKMTYQDIFSMVRFICCTTLGLSEDNIYVMYDKAHPTLHKAIRFPKIPYDYNRLKCPLPIDDSACYVKINYHFNNGLVPIMNLCLVHQDLEGAKVDSILYPERLLFILNENDHPYCEPHFAPTVRLLQQSFASEAVCCGIANHLRVICYLRIQGLQSGSKGIQYVLRKFERELFVEFFTFPEGEQVLRDAVESVVANDILFQQNQPNSDLILDSFIEEFVQYKLMLAKSIAHLNIEAKPSYSQAQTIHSTYGIPPKLLKRVVEKRYGVQLNWPEKGVGSPPYHYKISENNIDDPIKWAESRQKTTFQKAWEGK